MKNIKRASVVAENWMEKLIRKAERRVDKGRQSLRHRFRHKLVFWVSVILLVKINLAISAVAVPVLAVMDNLFFDAIVILTGLIVGVMYSFLLVDVAHLERHHHFLAVVLVPLAVVINMVLVGGIVEGVIGSARSDLWVLAILYGAAFIVPYFVDLVRVEHGRTSIHKVF